MEPNTWVAIANLAPNYVLAGVCLYMMWKIATNHIEHNTAAVADLSKAITELVIYLKTQKGQ